METIFVSFDYFSMALVAAVLWHGCDMDIVNNIQILQYTDLGIIVFLQ